MAVEIGFAFFRADRHLEAFKISISAARFDQLLKGLGQRLKTVNPGVWQHATDLGRELPFVGADIEDRANAVGRKKTQRVPVEFDIEPHRPQSSFGSFFHLST